MKQYLYSVLIFALTLTNLNIASAKERKAAPKEIVIENAEMRLVLSSNGKAISLKHKPTGQECLEKGANVPLCSITEYRPYDNEYFLTFPAKQKILASDTIYRVGDELKVGFEFSAYTATIKLNITDSYIGFKLSGLDYKIEAFGEKRRTEIDEFTLLQLPVQKRKYFGEWLNVVWDNKVAVNVLATDPYAKIDGFKEDRYIKLSAGMENNVKLMGVGAALITTSTNKLLDRIDQLEKDYNLPRGVESRRCEAYKYSYYELRDVTPQNIDEHIAYAKQGGFHMIVIYYPDFATSMGHFPWNSKYPNGMADLQTITRKIKEAGMIPGFHIHYSKAAKDDPYVSPIPDPRLNLVRTFTLRESIDSHSTVIPVEENPENCTLDDERRFLKIGNELITYQNYTTTPPYQFTGCKRGELNSKISSFEKGFKLGLLDVDTWPLFIRFDQNTSIQQEVAERLGEIYSKAGFQFVYFDGAEDVHPPYWYNVSKSQLIVYNCLKPAPLLSEGALKSHFGWHILTRANAFDLYRPEYIRPATKKYPAYDARYIAQDFTSINFGWNNYLAPSNVTIGMQPDMYEYICSRGAAWDCPIALMGKLNHIKEHPRTKDNFEVIRNWEEARIQNFFTEKQKEELKNLDQEHILLKNETGKFELHPYRQITLGNDSSSVIRSFIFRRDNKTYVVYWHSRGEAKIELPLGKQKIQLFETNWKEIPVPDNNGKVIIPANDRRYLVFNLSQKRVINLLQNAKIIQ
ncbi:MAG: hypothetical protein Q8862_06590 [Bacteroidota bacterium]|nr:hypothetical protein [Bacteroidota bacterium]MDP4205297.1 hypothetical protein [Bacteroidota bacterium]